MAIQVVVSGFAVGSAVIGFWFAVRFREHGPRSLRSALLALLAALLMLNASVPLVGIAALELGSAAALLGVVLPTLALFFWSCACAMRVFVGLLSGAR
jgi:hypothetical protein